MKYKVTILTGLIGSAIASLFGGWDAPLQTLVIFMAVDWFTGGILLPGVFGKSPKSANGAMESRAGWKGLCRKAMTFVYVLVAARLDMLMRTDYLRDAVRIKCPACRQEVELHLEKCDRKREARMNAYFHRIINSKENRD